jgi:hypothetical protein
MAEVIDNRALHRFELSQGGHVAELVYESDGGRLVLVHTGVPVELSGHGIGGQLVQGRSTRRPGTTSRSSPSAPMPGAGWTNTVPNSAPSPSRTWPDGAHNQTTSCRSRTSIPAPVRALTQVTSLR